MTLDRCLSAQLSIKRIDTVQLERTQYLQISLAHLLFIFTCITGRACNNKEFLLPGFPKSFLGGTFRLFLPCTIMAYYKINQTKISSECFLFTLLEAISLLNISQTCEILKTTLNKKISRLLCHPYKEFQVYLYLCSTNNFILSKGYLDLALKMQ